MILVQQTPPVAAGRIVSQPRTSDPSNRRYDLDLFRFLAALAVLLFHYTFRGFAADGLTIMPFAPGWRIAKYGYLAVEFFFMISGYVILMSARNSTAGAFAINRACCTLTFLCGRLSHDPVYSVPAGIYLKNMTLGLEFFKVPPVDGVYWSLVIELRFYILVFLVLLAGRMAKIRVYLFAWALLSLLLLARPVFHLNSWFVPEYAGFFISGCCFYLVEVEGWTPLRFLTLLCSFALAIISALRNASDFTLHYHQTFRPAVVVTAIGLFFLLFWLFASGRTKRLASPWFAILGAVSYPLYLLHENLGFMLFNNLYPRFSPGVLTLAAGSLMILASWLVCRYFEKRGQLLLKRFLERLMAWI